MARPASLTAEQIAVGEFVVANFDAGELPPDFTEADRLLSVEVAIAGAYLLDRLEDHGRSCEDIDRIMDAASQIQAAVTMAGFRDPWPAVTAILDCERHGTRLVYDADLASRLVRWVLARGVGRWDDPLLDALTAAYGA